MGAQARRKVFSLKTLQACNGPFVEHVAKVVGFMLHPGVEASAHEG